MNILIAPFSRKLNNGRKNAKNYPFWRELIWLLKTNKHAVHQIGTSDELALTEVIYRDQSLNELKQLLIQHDFWISVDSFLPHLAHHVARRGVVLWGPSDPLIFGYDYNLNLLKDRVYLRPDQFNLWEAQPFKEEAFIAPIAVLNVIEKTITKEWLEQELLIKNTY